jgi:hypothetical protein
LKGIAWDYLVGSAMKHGNELLKAFIYVLAYSGVKIVSTAAEVCDISSIIVPSCIT